MICLLIGHPSSSKSSDTCAVSVKPYLIYLLSPLRSAFRRPLRGLSVGALRGGGMLQTLHHVPARSHVKVEFHALA